MIFLKTLRRLARMPVALAALITFGCASRIADAADIWLAAVDPVVRAAHHWDASADYMDLFLPDAPWATVAKHTRVFKIGPGFASQGSDADLKQLFANLQRRHIALALEIGLLSISDHCHEKTEAYGEPGLVERVLQRIKRLGGHLDYLAMDEPFFYGHQYAGPDACKLSASQLAQDIAPNVAIAKTIFPGIKIGDVEVVYDSAAFLDATKEWIDAYAKATGTPLAFFHADESWSPQATQQLVPLAAFLKQRQIHFGVIYNAGPQGTSDALWAQAATRHADQVESELALQPDDALFQTWEPFPTRLLPETESGTLTNIALRYLRAPSRLSLTQKGARLEGRLTDGKGTPVAHAAILLSTFGDTSHDGGMVRKTVTGKVPANARAAVLAVRVNQELSCMACTGAVVARLGPATYRETTEGGETDQRFTPAVIDVSATHTMATNSAKFPIQPDAGFTFEIPVAVRTQAEHASSVGVLFVDALGHEVQRRMIRLETTEAQLGTAETDTDGRFAFALRPGFADGTQPAFTAQFDGSDTLRGASARSLPRD
ncbi:hypothetical protein [Ralstonia sp. A12]|uniref:hypothetical protein n=1 Tax=Ralstonia sp. A12 TaxID=1217052 RepID=UPI00057D8F6A|nr:hypothetical protein [Ralstonia sp. A12]